MTNQSFSNHRRLARIHHFVMLPFVFLIVVGALINVFVACREGSGLLSSILILCLAKAMFLFLFVARVASLRAQDRAIRAEENLRHFVLTGKLLDARLRMGQIIALRFAPDEEFVQLAHRAAEEKLPTVEIKKSIKNWKADYNRV